MEKEHSSFARETMRKIVKNNPIVINNNTLFMYQQIGLHCFRHVPASKPDTHSTVAYNIWIPENVFNKEEHIFE